MLHKLYHNIRAYWLQIANIGITDDLSFHEKKKNQLLNIVVASSATVNLFFCIVNLSHQKTLLGIINFLLMSGGIIILVINSYRKFLISRVILTFLGSLLFTASAILFKNGGEYYLVANLVIILIYFNDPKFLVSICIFNCLLFIGIKIFLQNGYVYDTLPFSRVVFNICWSLAIIVLALLFFKNEQIIYQGQIEQKNKELEKLNDTKQKLFSIIAHDLRSPIGQLKNSLDLVSKQHLSPEAFQQISSKLSSEVDHLHSTLDNLLRWSISQLHGIKVMPVKTSLQEVIDKQAILFKQSLELKNIRFSQQNLDVFVFADPDHLMLIIRNLISNSIKYSYENGNIIIRSYPKDDCIMIEVADDGMGMNEQVRASLFSNGSMVSNAGTSNEKGTGLGLKLCKEFIEHNNGRLWVESTEGKGTTFYISLPAAN
jgi:signal transduction histidine kinase